MGTRDASLPGCKPPREEGPQPARPPRSPRGLLRGAGDSGAPPARSPRGAVSPAVEEAPALRACPSMRTPDHRTHSAGGQRPRPRAPAHPGAPARGRVDSAGRRAGGRVQARSGRPSRRPGPWGGRKLWVVGAWGGVPGAPCPARASARPGRVCAPGEGGGGPPCAARRRRQGALVGRPHPPGPSAGPGPSVGPASGGSGVSASPRDPRGALRGARALGRTRRRALRSRVP